MKRLIIVLIPILLCVGCADMMGHGEVTCEWFNLSTNQIWVVNAEGLPPEASAGNMLPDHAEDQLEVKASHFFGTVRIADQNKIEWKDGGAQGWSGGLKSGEMVPPGVMHEAKLNRAELGIPAKVTHVKVRFTYLGVDKWRVKMYGLATTYEGTDRVKDFSPPYIP